MDAPRGDGDRELRRPLLPRNKNNNANANANTRSDGPGGDEEALILEEWNASVSEFLARDGSEENSRCYCCPSFDGVPEGGRSGGDDPSESESSGGGELPRNYLPEAAPSRGALCGTLSRMMRSTLLPDCEPTLGSYYVRSGSSDESNNNNENEGELYQRRPRRVVDGVGVVRFAKFAGLTLASIALVRCVVVREFPDHDRYLRLWQVFFYEGDSILRDLCVFFVVGRMHLRPGVDCIEWVLVALVANVYFECQGYLPWMQHAVTLYEMHCLWPWQLWAFAVLVACAFVGVVVAHAFVASKPSKAIAWIKLAELLVCAGVFLAPVVSSPYFHLHHWFAGWLLGMHANLHDRWWSRATMAYCWGMYVNGIAVYGRDPLLTCDYARFLSEDQGCPVAPMAAVGYAAPSRDGGGGGWWWWWPASLAGAAGVDGLQPADWRNCSSSGYHP
ncbi:unnamed protein product [Pseudo-nitzschia multistriata]|uniref:Uncharacterized protein n=1 Tax=Pseudo-nitzschia multistriata TaxID=183589 RepID=A0A448ZJH6_9STRA|nr:unnamed protein product [Pseudo-nitzschia multistriata]